MKLIKAAVFSVCVLCLSAAGCGREDTVYLESAEQTEAMPESGTRDAEDAQRSAQVNDNQRSAQENDNQRSAQVNDNLRAEDSLCYVYVCGAVECPGVYALAENSRIYEAVAMAGGFCADARKEAVNQAGTVADGQMIYIPSEEETESGSAAEALNGTDTTADGRVDLNTASVEQLMTLPGIGKAKAESIVNYREENGAFSSAADVMKVEGIKEGIYNRLKDSIKVN